MVKKTVTGLVLVLGLTGCTSAGKTAVDRTPEINNCNDLAHSEIYRYWSDPETEMAFGQIENVEITNLEYQDLGSAKGRITGKFVLTFDPARPGGNNGYIVCAVDGAAVSLEDWNIDN